jgi:hypothetical protein
MKKLPQHVQDAVAQLALESKLADHLRIRKEGQGTVNGCRVALAPQALCFGERRKRNRQALCREEGQNAPA